MGSGSVTTNGEVGTGGSSNRRRSSTGSTDMTWSTATKKWRKKKGPHQRSLSQIEGLGISTDHENGLVQVLKKKKKKKKKRVMVLVDHDQSTQANKDAIMWALTHVADKGDQLILLQIIPPPPHSNINADQPCKKLTISSSSSSPSSSCSSSIDPASLLTASCKAFKPEVEVEALSVEGPKLPTVLSQVKKHQISVLVLGQKKPPISWLCIFSGSSSTSDHDFVEQCISKAECLTVAVRKRSRDVGGYLITTRWQKNFWLLA